MILARILDHELAELADWTRPIERDYIYEFSHSVPHAPLDLAKVFLAAQALFGRTSLRFDPDEGSFRFPLLLLAKRDGFALRYLILLQDRRGSIEAPFYRLQNERRTEMLAQDHASIDRELSRPEINHLTDHLIGFLRAHGGGLAAIAPSFHRIVPSEFLVYGNRSGELFERVLANEDEYRRLPQIVKSALADSESKEELEYVQDLLGDMSRGEVRQR